MEGTGQGEIVWENLNFEQHYLMNVLVTTEI
jgi:hypothetical protein